MDTYIFSPLKEQTFPLRIFFVNEIDGGFSSELRGPDSMRCSIPHLYDDDTRCYTLPTSSRTYSIDQHNRGTSERLARRKKFAFELAPWNESIGRCRSSDSLNIADSVETHPVLKGYRVEEGLPSDRVALRGRFESITAQS
jgi:hypothetical protein